MKNALVNKEVLRLLREVYHESINEDLGPISRLEGSILMALSKVVGLKREVFLLDAGAGLGFSTYWLILGLTNIPNIDATIDVVEFDEHRFKKLIVNIKRLLEVINGGGLKINYINEDAVDYLERTLHKYDMVFIDIEKHQYPEALKAVENKVEYGGVVVFHNVITPPPPPGFIERLYERPWKTTIIPTRRGLSVSIKLS